MWSMVRNVSWKCKFATRWHTCNIQRENKRMWAMSVTREEKMSEMSTLEHNKTQGY